MYGMQTFLRTKQHTYTHISTQNAEHNFSLFPSLSRTCAFLADVGQLVVAGHIVPFAILMGDHHHAVLSSRKEIIRLVLPPVLILLQEAQKYFRHKHKPLTLIAIYYTLMPVNKYLTNVFPDTENRFEVLDLDMDMDIYMV